MNKQHEREEFRYSTHSGKVHHYQVHCMYCNLAARATMMQLAHFDYYTTQVTVRDFVRSEEYEEYTINLWSVNDEFMYEMLNADLDQCGCVPGSPFSARVMAMIEGMEE